MPTLPKFQMAAIHSISLSKRHGTEQHSSVDTITSSSSHEGIHDHKETNMPKSKMISSFLPRLPVPPVIVSMLNNKGAVLIERKQYTEAQKSLRRALRMAEKEEDSSSNTETMTGYEASCCPIRSIYSATYPLQSASAAAPQNQLFMHRSEYDEGMDFFKLPLRLKDSSRSLGTILFNLGRASHDQGNYQDALNYYKRSLKAIEQRKDRDEPLEVALLSCIGQIQHTWGDHVGSLKTFAFALSIAQVAFGEQSLECAACLNCIGVLHYVMPSGSEEEALEALQGSLECRIQLLGKDHIDVGTTCNNIGRVLVQQGQYEGARDSYCEALRIRRLCQNDSVDVAATLFNIGQVCHQEGERDKALRLYQEFLKLAKLHFGDFHRDVCIVSTCIGQVLHELKEYGKALKAYHNALRVGKVALGPIHPEVAIALNKIGNLYYETGDLESALKAYHQGLEVEVKVLENGNPNTCVTYMNIAEIHKQRMEFDEALRFYDKVLKLQRENNVSDVETASTLSNIAYILDQKGDNERALDVSQECLRIRREALGEDHEDLAGTLVRMALILLKLDRCDLALEALLEAYRIRQRLGSLISKRDLVFTLYNIALIHHAQGNLDDALSFYLETARIEKNSLGMGVHRDLSITYYNIGQIHYLRGELQLALTKFHEALEIERECFGDDHVACARTLNEIGNIELQLGNVDNVMDCFTTALRIYRKNGMEDNRLVTYGLELWRLEVAHPETAAVA